MYSQFGCPFDAFEENNDNDTVGGKGGSNTKWKVKDGFPEGILRLIQHPHWISRGCSIPTTATCQRGYNEWANLAEQQKRRWRGRGRRFPPPPAEYQCGNQLVTPMNTGSVRTAFDSYFKAVMNDRTSPQSKVMAYGWAHRFGATPEEAEYFSTMPAEFMGENIHKFISALANRSGLLRLQPWIERDVAQYLKRSKLVPNTPYDAIHVRRGDKLLKESGAWVAKYWTSKGYSKGNFPTNYVPFTHYIEMGWKEGLCRRAAFSINGIMRQHIIHTTPPNLIFVATDDPKQIKKEISNLAQTTDVSCEKDSSRFLFPASSEATTFHVTPCQKYKKTCPGDDCHKRYQRIIAAVGDMMILSRANKLVCDYNSSWGRIIKGFRTVFDDNNNNSIQSLTNRHAVVVKDVVDLSPWGGRFTPFGY